MTPSLEHYLAEDARLYPEKIAIVSGSEELTYAELYARVCRRAEELTGDRRVVTLRSSQTIGFLVEYFALHLAGFVVAPLENGTPEEKFREITDWLTQWETPEGAADVLYTTGTTGRSKGVIVSHQALIADAENLIQGQGFSHDLAFVINGPLNHIGSLSKVWPVILLGATLIITDGLRSVNDFFEAFSWKGAKKFATFLVPASIRILIQFGAQQIALLKDRIDFVETGAAAITHDDMLTLCQLLPHSRLYNTYASTETGIISTYNFNDGRCMAGCLGRPMRHSRIIITSDGLISCQGPTLMTGYIGEPERTATVLHDDAVFTNDIGRLDAEGMLHLSGRQDDVINVGGFKISPTEVEDAAMAYSSVRDCICIATSHPITGSALKLLVVCDEGTPLNKRALALFLKSKLEIYKVPQLYEMVDAIKRTYNGKLDRKYYVSQKL